MKSGGIAVMPTDTIYGLVARAEDKEAVERVYSVRKRAPEKPCIILIGDEAELEKFGVVLSEEQKREIEKLWPGAVSIVLDVPGEEFSYLHRGTGTLAFRLPAQSDLRELLKQTGPLIAPSANPEGLPPAKNIREAKEYFGDEVDFYADGGEIGGRPSKLVRLYKDGSVEVLRS